MKLSRRTKYVLAAPLFVVASLALQFSTAVPTYAATVSWNGQGDGTSFSDTANWTSGQVPQNGDTLVFSVAGLTEQTVLDNDLNNLSVAAINFTGAVNQYNTYTLQGNDITLTGNITNYITGANAAYAVPTIQNNLTLNSTVFATKVHLGVDGSTINLQSNALNFVGAPDTCGFNLSSNISGSGSLNVMDEGVNVRGTNTFTGAISVTGDAVFAPTAFGTAAAGTTVSGSGKLRVAHTSNTSIAEPFNFGGTGSFGAVQGFQGCSGGDGPAVTLTLTGPVQLSSDFKYAGINNTVISGSYTSNGHSFTVAGGTTGTLTTADGEAVAPEETIQIDGESSETVNLGSKQTGILNGTRNIVTVGAGALLKGTGKAGAIFVGDGGRINPGNSPGTITALMEFVIGGTYDLEILNAENYDKVNAGEFYSGSSNAVTILSTATLNPILFDGWSIKQGDTFTIINNQSSTPIQGTFDGLDEGAQFVVDGITFNITYVGGDGNDVVITALNAGNDPDAPNTGVATFVRANPAIVAGFGILAAGVLIAIAIRRRNTQ